MLKKLRTTTLLLMASPLLIQCVPSQDVNSLDLRIRNLDNQVFQLGKTVNRLGGSAGPENPLEQIQARQAEMADNIDRLNSEIMRLKGKIEETSHQSRNSQADSRLQQRVDELSQQVASLGDQVNQNTSALKTGQPVGIAMAAPSKAPPKPSMDEPAPAKLVEDTAGTETKIAASPEKKKTDEVKQPPANDSEAASPGDPGKAIYDKGLELFRASKFNEAYRTFSDYLSKFPKGKMAPNARFWLGDCYYNQQEFELAILEYQKVIADYPTDSKAPSALLKQGLAFEKLKDNETAKIVYNKLLKEYPKSDQVDTAKKRLDSFK